MVFTHPNPPNAARLMESLRHLGYGNYEALADIVDNSIDAYATRIQLFVHQRSGEIEIIIADNGAGMGNAVLDEAMKLGSDVQRDLHSDLGKFGMGLVTASLSIARNCHVITKGPDGYLSSIQDVDEIIAQNKFVKHLDRASPNEVAHFDDIIGSAPTGTMVILRKCDNLTNRTTSSFASNVRSHLGRVHRYFIDAGRVLEVNGDRVDARDPLQLGDPGTEVVLDELIPVLVSLDGIKREEQIRVRIALIPDTPVGDLDVAKSLKAQGFYVMRNLREVMNAITLDFFNKHNDYNRMRGEIFFSADLDKLVGIEFTKRQVDLDQSLNDQLAQILKPILTAIKRRESTRNRVEAGDVQARTHQQSAKAIAEKDKLLLKPKARVEKRGSPVNTGRPTEPLGNGNRDRKNLTRTQALESRLNCEFREERLGPNGQVYEADLEGRKIIIRYNIEHPFYQRFLTDSLSDTRMAIATDFLIFSLAAAELRMLEDGDLDAVNNFKMVMSSNLRTLLN